VTDCMIDLCTLNTEQRGKPKDYLLRTIMKKIKKTTVKIRIELRTFLNL
jgi:hypothetical protein